MNISPAGGRLMRAVICALLAATVFPSIISAATSVETEKVFPFSEPGCFETVAGTARFHEVTVLNDDGTMHTTTSLRSVEVTGALSGARYTAGEQTLFTFQVEPAMVLEKDVITKLTRVGEALFLGFPVADDMVMKMHIHTTITPNLEASSSFSHPVFQCN